MTYNTLNNIAIVGIKLDYEKKTAEKIMYNNDVIIHGYWDCVQYCLINAWGQLPTWWQIICEGACGGCIWGGNAFICGGCLSCLAGYGIGCGTVCA